jgi:hypothetical protein
VSPRSTVAASTPPAAVPKTSAPAYNTEAAHASKAYLSGYIGSDCALPVKSSLRLKCLPSRIGRYYPDNLALGTLYAYRFCLCLQNSESPDQTIKA